MPFSIISDEFLLPSPLVRLEDEYTSAAGVALYLKREDLIHQQISGNKYRKLFYNLHQARAEGKQTLLTFGGAYSNHIYATAAAGYLHGFQTIGVIRGEATEPLNETLAFAQAAGMRLHYASREAYRHKTEAEFIEKLRHEFGDFYLVPEGGSNAFAVRGCEQIISELEQEFDYVACACGTGGTLAGLVVGLLQQNKKANVLGVPVLKGADFLYQDIAKLLADYQQVYNIDYNLPQAAAARFELFLDYHFGGYAKRNQDLDKFIVWFQAKHDVPIEFVYTGKILFGIYDLIKKEYIRKGQKVVIIHTGGLR
ncbi:1-aminocyclopropane-1-carboxylate deaminase/D-cysteine desulfhydrase [Flexibacter flexilis]|nr:pyridoxal-phosphate dependent enzyme [Flexibacter flexilis]